MCGKIMRKIHEYGKMNTQRCLFFQKGGFHVCRVSFVCAILKSAFSATQEENVTNLNVLVLRS